MYEKHIIEEFLIDGHRYRTCTPKTMRKCFSTWRKSLTCDELKALRKYRKKIGLKNNINAKLRSGILPRDAELISEALQRAAITEPTVVYRTLAKQEYINMSKLQEGNVFVCPDFKGVHVGKKISNRNKLGHIMLILMPPNTPAAYINNVTCCFAHERELLIDKGQCFKLLEKRKFLGKEGYVVKVENIQSHLQDNI